MADQGGASRAPPLSPIIFPIFMHFSAKIIPNNRLVPPHVVDTPLGNPESATGSLSSKTSEMVKIMDSKSSIYILGQNFELCAIFGGFLQYV